MENNLNGAEIPMDPDMILANNLDAMNYYSGLSKDLQQKIMENPHSLRTKEEMQAYVDSFVNGGGIYL